MSRSHYEILGASPDADATQLRRAYLRRARQLHPDQFADRPAAERARAERRMQELNGAWSVLSDPRQRRTYDASLRPGTGAGTGRIVSGRASEWRPFDPSRPPPRPTPKPAPQVADERDMEVRGPAKLLRPLPLLLLFGSLVMLIVISSLVGGDGDDDPGPGAPVVLPTGTPIGCVDLLPVAEEVPCGNHDAVVWSVVAAGERCPDDLEAFYRQSLGGLYCVTRAR